MITQTKKLRVSVSSALVAMSVGAAALAQPASAPAQTQPATTKPAESKPVDLPSAQAIMDKYVEAIGGKEKIEKVKFRVVKGKLGIAAANINGTFEAYSKSPNVMKSSVDIPSIGKMERGTDGTVGWETSAVMGPRLLEGTELETMLREADMQADLNTAKNYTMEVVGREKVGEKDAYVVKLTNKKDKSVSKQHFDVESGLMVKRTEKMASQMGEIETVSTLEDYRDFGGIRTPAKTTMRIPQMEQVMTIESVEYPETLGDDKFTLPADIKELVDKQKNESVKPPVKDAKPEEKK